MLRKIVFRGFRNLADGDWRPQNGRHLLVGPNGAGKTSLLEAIYLLATCKSFRAARLAECVRHGAGEFSLFGSLGGGARAELEVSWDPQGLRRRANGKLAALADYLAALPVVAWSAASARLVDGQPEQRRRFLDQGVVGIKPAALEILGRYRRALDQKRRLLKDRGEGLDAWNELLAGAGAELAALRSAYLRQLESAFAESTRQSGLQLPPLELRYRPSPADALEGAASFLETLRRLEDREREAGQPLVGPQRDELMLYWGEHEVRRVGSAGERKLFGMLLTVARGRVLTAHGRAPVFLLDDIDAELDRGRLEHLWGLFSSCRQLFATTTTSGLTERLGGVSGWAVEGGVVGPGRGPEAKP